MSWIKKKDTNKKPLQSKMNALQEKIVSYLVKRQIPFDVNFREGKFSNIQIKDGNNARLIQIFFSPKFEKAEIYAPICIPNAEQFDAVVRLMQDINEIIQEDKNDYQ